MQMLAKKYLALSVVLFKVVDAHSNVAFATVCASLGLAALHAAKPAHIAPLHIVRDAVIANVSSVTGPASHSLRKPRAVSFARSC